MDYQSLIKKYEIRDIQELYRLFDQEIIYDWIKLYEDISVHGEITIQNFYGYTYAIDDGNQFIPAGQQPKEMLEGRVVAVYGISNNKINHSNRKTMRKWIGPTGEIFKPYGDNYDKGHFIAHGLGGPIDVNLFPQRRDINRGWSEKGKLYRQMEKFIAANQGTFVFSRPLYTDLSFCPTALEFGYCDKALNFTVNEFPNK
ncbi:DNA/RNA non-specific endonuclease [Ferruginibacter sp.]